MKLVGAIKTGAVFALYLGDVRIDHADFKTKLCKKVSHHHFFRFVTLCLAQYDLFA